VLGDEVVLLIGLNLPGQDLRPGEDHPLADQIGRQVEVPQECRMVEVRGPLSGVPVVGAQFDARQIRQSIGAVAPGSGQVGDELVIWLLSRGLVSYSVAHYKWYQLISTQYGFELGLLANQCGDIGRYTRARTYRIILGSVDEEFIVVDPALERRVEC